MKRPMKRSVLALATAALVALAFAPGAGRFEKNVKFDSVFGLPVPPVHWRGDGTGSFDAHATTIATACFLAIFAAAVIWGIVESLKARSLIPVCLSLSGTLCVFAELNLDVMGGVTYANSSHSVAFSLMGHHMGWFVVAAWSAYGGLFALAAYKVFSRPQLSNKAIWLGLLLVCAGQTFFEEMLGYFNGIYYYYGHQPLTPFTQFAWWIILPTSGGVCLLSALVYRFNAHLRGPRALLVIAVAPFTFCGFMGAVSLPAWIAVNSDLSRPLTQAFGLMSVVAGLAAFAVMMKLVLNREPFESAGLGAEY